MNPTDRYVWHCPTCGRHVPQRVDACRCGSSRPGDTSSAEVPAAHPPAAAAGRRSVLPLLIGLMLGLGLAAISFWSPWADTAVRRDPETMPASTASPEPGPTLADAGLDTTPGQTGRGGEPVTYSDDTLRSAAASRAVGDSLADPTPAGVTSGAGGQVDALSASGALEDVIARVLPAVVSIRAGQGRGTGFFVRPDVVLTNAHVVGEQSSVQLAAGEQTYTARVSNVSAGSDLAVLQVYNAAPQQPTLRLGSVTGLRAGQEVIAIGSALGVLSNTVTRGIVSAVRSAGSITLIQTDAAINPGNSGGPLIDRTGVVIGVNSMRIAASQGGEGLAFAVAIDHAVELLGGQSSSTAVTPLQGLNRLMSGGSTSDDMREQGTQAYRRALDEAVRRGDAIDTFWDGYANSCVASAVRTGGRAWFAVYEPDGLQLTASSRYDCQSWLTRLRAEAGIVREEVAKATEAARRQGVYPGVMRDLRRESRMEWPGWGR